MTAVVGDDQAAATAAGEARSIAEQLGCQPLADRADTALPTRPRLLPRPGR